MSKRSKNSNTEDNRSSSPMMTGAMLATGLVAVGAIIATGAGSASASSPGEKRKVDSIFDDEEFTSQASLEADLTLVPRGSHEMPPLVERTMEPTVGDSTTTTDSGMRAIMYRPSEGNWYCKGVGKNDWNGSDNNIVFHFGNLCDQPIILDIFGDGPRACIYSKSDGLILVKSRGRFSWDDKKSEFGYNTENTTLTCVFPGSAGFNFQHDELFAFTPTIATLSKGPIHPIVYRGTEQLFYVQSQTGTKVSQLIATKFWDGFNGSYGPYTVNELSDTDYLAAKLQIWKTGSFHFQYGAAGDIPIFADFFNENICRPGVFRPSTGHWYIKACKGGINGGAEISFQCGQPGNNNVPLVADIFNEGINRIIIYNPNDGIWAVKQLGTGDWDAALGAKSFQCGGPGYIPLVGNLFGDGIRAIVFKHDDKKWFVKGLGMGSYADCPDSVDFQFGETTWVPLVGNALSDGPRVCAYSPSDGKWHCKAVGRKSWGSMEEASYFATTSIQSASKDVVFQSGVPGDCPIILNIMGHGFRATNFRPSNKQWLFKEQSTKDWDSQSTNSNIETDFANSSQNTHSVNTSAKLPLYQGVVSTKYWPLTYSPFLNEQTGE